MVEEKISKVYKIKFIVIRVKMQPITEKFCFRTVTLKELYDTIDYLYSIKIPGPGIFNAWAIKAAKFAIETYLQFVFKLCISWKYFPRKSETCFH